MEILNKSVTLTNDPPEFTALDFTALRTEGIGYLQQLAGDTWTDHNLHDPGITILDQLCYGLTDLSYRISMDIKDLLARPDGKTYNSLYSPAAILTTNPVTIADFRKVLLDIPGVKNAWIEKINKPQPPIYFDPERNTLSLSYEQRLASDGTLVPFEHVNIRGLYRVFIAKTRREVSEKATKEQVRARLHECRNLCEDFDEVNIMSSQRVTLKGVIEVGNTADANLLAAKILYKVGNWLSPAISFYTLQQMLAKGKTIDEIMDGPVLNHGFIDDDELRTFNRRSKLYASDLIREMMAEPGVRVTENLLMETAGQAENNWVLDLDVTRFPELDEEACLSDNLQFQKNGQPLKINKDAVLSYLIKLRETAVPPILSQDERDIIPDMPSVRNLGAYYSIQNHFPQVYGIGEIGLQDSAPEARKAQAKQLKAYLLFFEQILANYFAQAAGLKNLFAFDNEDITTYFQQTLIGKVPDIEGLLHEDYPKNIAGLTEADVDALERKDRFLNHLLARFGENLADYSLWLNDRFKNDDVKAEVTGTEPVSSTDDPLHSEKSRLQSYKRKLIGDKLNFLLKYPEMSTQRGKGFNYAIPGWENQNVSGLEKRIAGKLGIANYTRSSLTGQKDGFHMIEHILLRPLPADKALIDRFMVPGYFKAFKKDKGRRTICTSLAHGLQNGDVILVNDKDKEQEYTVSGVLVDRFIIECDYDEATIATREVNKQPQLRWIRRDINSTIFAFDGQQTAQGVTRDPYSFQLTFVFAQSNTRFNNDSFRKFIETTIREETPAHLTVYIRWLSDDALKRFEDALKVFLTELEELNKLLP
ncbi:hypothetical protein [Pedobacter psychroterrae]|uniref:Uncharacterized protein n=1 Tax=Pedobacter psychroterrae TaxID=2530453 RepID=A0A4V6N620_9SPHI|nr:hypothetical protein [Pedobacter psychroterrae]TCD01777.1 hypothetical protein EZ437_13760 [Pedobacter psychroterrae]